MMRFNRRSVMLLGLLVAVTAALAAVAAVSRPADASSSAAAAAPTCNLGHGVSHVINIVFDNVHFSRDNPNVPSDLEQMPHLLNFLKDNGTVFSNTHTPLIAHTANDSLTIYSGLYGDRHGQGLSNSYKTYNPDGSTDPATSFTYWTSPIIDTKTNPPFANPIDTAPSMVYSDRVPAAGAGTSKITPAPWVPFTRAGCTVGNFSTANMVLENSAVDVPTVFGAGSAEASETAANPDPFKGIQTARYIGEAVHCAQGATICSSSSRPVADVLPTEPGGYNGYQALFGAKYIAPAIGGGPNHFHGTYRVTDANGNLVDLDGNRSRSRSRTSRASRGSTRPRRSRSQCWPTCRRPASRSPTATSPTCTRRRRIRGRLHHDRERRAGRPVGPGDSCYVANAQHYDAAFQKFFDRLAADGITPANTLFVISAEENDQFAGANVGRAIQPTPPGLRRRHRAVQLRQQARSASCRRTSRACSPARLGIARSSTSSRRARRSTFTASRPRTTRPSASSNATRRR